MEWLALVGLGFIVGCIAGWILPSRANHGLISTIILGVLGALIGGWLGPKFDLGTVTGFDGRSIALATGGSLLLIIVARGLRR